MNIYTTPSGHKCIKKIKGDIKKHLLTKILQLKNNPYLGEKLTGKHFLLHSLHTNYKGTQYRIIYEIRNNEEIFVHYLGTRENIYKELDRLKLKLPHYHD